MSGRWRGSNLALGATIRHVVADLTPAAPRSCTGGNRPDARRCSGSAERGCVLQVQRLLRVQQLASSPDTIDVPHLARRPDDHESRRCPGRSSSRRRRGGRPADRPPARGDRGPPGIGRPRAAARVGRLPRRRADLIAVMDALGIGRAALVGNSLGGMLAFDTAIGSDVTRRSCTCRPVRLAPPGPVQSSPAVLNVVSEIDRRMTTVLLLPHRNADGPSIAAGSPPTAAATGPAGVRLSG